MHIRCIPAPGFKVTCNGRTLKHWSQSVLCSICRKIASYAGGTFQLHLNDTQNAMQLIAQSLQGKIFTSYSWSSPAILFLAPKSEMNEPERFLVDRHCLLYDNKLMNNVLILLNL